MTSKHVLNYTELPEHLRAGMRRYIEQGVAPGRFLRACLENDLRGAVTPSVHAENLKAVVSWIYWECPGPLQGSAKKVADWIKENE